MSTILLAEDNAENRDALSRRLERRGFEVLMAVDGSEAFTLAKDRKPDLILMDMNMPNIDGWEATRLIKSESETRLIPVIALTAHAMAGDRERALQAGCTDYHTKPIEFAKLVAQIETLLPKAPGAE